MSTALYRHRFGTVAGLDDPSDPIGDLHRRCGSEPLRTANIGAGAETEYFTEGHVTARNMRRLYAAGLLSRTRGLWADEMADIYGWTDGADSFVAHYVETCLAALNARRAGRDGRAWHERVEPEPEPEPAETCTVAEAPAVGVPACTLPEPMLEYLARLIHGPKADYAAEYAYHLTHGTPAPADPGAPWAGKARHKLESLHRRGAR